MGLHGSLSKWGTYLRVAVPTAKNARPTRTTKLRSTKSLRNAPLPRAVVVTTESSRVMVVRQNPSSGRRQSPQADPSEALQTFRTWRRQEEEGTDDSVLGLCSFCLLAINNMVEHSDFYSLFQSLC